MKVVENTGPRSRYVDCSSVNVCYMDGETNVVLRNAYSGADVSLKDIPKVIEALEFFRKEASK